MVGLYTPHPWVMDTLVYKFQLGSLASHVLEPNSGISCFFSSSNPGTFKPLLGHLPPRTGNVAAPGPWGKKDIHLSLSFAPSYPILPYPALPSRLYLDDTIPSVAIFSL